MSRAGIVALFLAVPLLGGAASAPSADPPSSLEPGPHGVVTVSHDHEKVTACDSKHSGAKLTCRAEQEKADAALTLRLEPVHTPALVGKDPRKPVSVRIPGGTSPQTARVRLRAGTWQIDWKGHKQHERFLIGDGDEFRLELTTLSGRCHKVKRACMLDPTRTQRTLKIPDSQRVPSQGEQAAE